MVYLYFVIIPNIRDIDFFAIFLQLPHDVKIKITGPLCKELIFF